TCSASRSIPASLIGASINVKAGGRVRFSTRPPAGCLCLRGRLAEGYVIRGIAGVRQPTLYIARTWIPIGRASAGSSLFPDEKYTLSIEIVKRSLPRRLEAPLDPPPRPGGRDNVPQPSGRRRAGRPDMAKSVYDDTYARSIRDHGA